MPEVLTLLDLLNAPSDEATAVILPESGRRLTYAELRHQVFSLADALAAAGVRPGDRVASVMPNGLPAIVTFLASSIVGTAAPLNPSYRADEFSFFLADTNARLLLCPPENAEARKAAEGRVPVLTVHSDPKGCVSLPGTSRTGHHVQPPGTNDVAIILHTSGSTGRPKRVPLRHSNLAAAVRSIARTYELSPDDVTFCPMPLFHLHGIVTSTLSTFFSGGTVVLPLTFNAQVFWGAVRCFGVTWYSAAPTFHQQLLAATGKERPPGTQRLRFVRSGSAAMPLELMRSLDNFFGLPVLEAYGMTETAQICSNPLPPRARKAGTVGPSIGVEVRIIDEAGEHLSAGKGGQVVVRGPHVTTGYENNPEANASSFVGGWFRTGDYGHLDSDGYLTLAGRIKELISRGGDKIGPQEIDDALLSHPDVAEAAAFGVPHPTLGEEVVAAIVLRNPQKQSVILAHCRERVAAFKCPKKLYVVSALPRTATGKIQRRTLAATITGRRD